MVDAPDLGSGAARRGGSIPFLSTTRRPYGLCLGRCRHSPLGRRSARHSPKGEEGLVRIWFESSPVKELALVLTFRYPVCMDSDRNDEIQIDERF